MALQLTLVSKKNPRSPTENPRYYVSCKASGVVNTAKILDELASCTGSTSDQCAAVISSFIDIISHKLTEGQVVKFKDLGSFRLTMNSQGHELPEQVSTESIRKVGILFKPDKNMKKRLNQVEFEKPEINKQKPHCL